MSNKDTLMDQRIQSKAKAIRKYEEKWSGGPSITRLNGFVNGYDVGFDDGLAVQPDPIDMLIFCPNCGKQHIDRPDPNIPVSVETLNFLHEATGGISGPDPDLYGRLVEAEYQALNANRWTNPVHKSHTCRKDDGGCGVIFRIADVPTNGVAEIKTKGKDDTWKVTDVRSVAGASG